MISNPNWTQRPSWALDQRPDRGRPAHYGWRAPVTLRYIKRWGPAALFTRFDRAVHPTETLTLVRSKRGAASDGKPPAAPPCSTTSTATPTSSPTVAARAQTPSTNVMEACGSSTPEVSGSSLYLSSLSLCLSVGL